MTNNQTKPVQPTKDYAVFVNGVMVGEFDGLKEALARRREHGAGSIYGRLFDGNRPMQNFGSDVEPKPEPAAA